MHLSIIVTYLSLFCAAFFPLYATPRIANAVGADSWGVISFAVLLQIFFLVLDSGFSQSLVTDFIKYKSNNNKLNDIFKFILSKYRRISIVLCFFLFLGALLVPYKIGIILLYLCFMIFFYLNASPYRSLIIAFEGHVYIGAFNILVQFIRYFFPLIFIYVFNIVNKEVVLICFVSSYCLDFYIKMIFSKRFLKNFSLKENESKLGKTIYIRATKMAAAVSVGAIAIYSDRIAMAIFSSKNYLGIYIVASTLSMAIIQVVYPIGQIVYPKIVEIKGVNGREKLKSLNNTLIISFSCLYMVGFFLYIFFGKYLMDLWLGDYLWKIKIEEIFYFMLIGCYFNSIFNILCWNIMARALSEYIYKIYLYAFIITMIFSLVLIKKESIIEAAYLWVLYNFLCLLFGFVFYKKIK